MLAADILSEKEKCVDWRGKKNKQQNHQTPKLLQQTKQNPLFLSPAINTEYRCSKHLSGTSQDRKIKAK